MANSGSKTIPKWGPKWSQGHNGRSSRNLRRHARIVCPPPWGAPFSLLFPGPKTQQQKVNIFAPICEPGSKMTPKSVLPGSPNGAKKHPKIIKNHLRGTLGAKGYPPRPARHPPDLKRHPKLLKSNQKCVQNEEGPRQLQMGETKRDSSPYEDMFFGSILLGRVPAPMHSKTQQ